MPTPPPKHMRLVPAPTAPNKLLQRQGSYLFGQFFLHSSTNFACPPQQNFSRPNSEQALTDFDLDTWIKQAEKNSFAKECGSVEEHSVAPASQLRARDSPTLVQKEVLRVGLIKGLDSDTDPTPASLERLLQKAAAISDALAPTRDMTGLQRLWLCDNLTTHYALCSLPSLKMGSRKAAPQWGLWVRFEGNHNSGFCMFLHVSALPYSMGWRWHTHDHSLETRNQKPSHGCQEDSQVPREGGKSHGNRPGSFKTRVPEHRSAQARPNMPQHAHMPGSKEEPGWQRVTKKQAEPCFQMSYILAPNKEMLTPLLPFCLRAHKFCLRHSLTRGPCLTWTQGFKTWLSCDDVKFTYWVLLRLNLGKQGRAGAGQKERKIPRLARRSELHPVGGVAGAGVRAGCTARPAFTNGAAAEVSGTTASVSRSCQRVRLFEISRMDALQHSMAWMWKRIRLDLFADQPCKITVASFLLPAKALCSSTYPTRRRCSKAAIKTSCAYEGKQGWVARQSGYLLLRRQLFNVARICTWLVTSGLGLDNLAATVSGLPLQRSDFAALPRIIDVNVVVQVDNASEFELALATQKNFVHQKPFLESCIIENHGIVFAEHSLEKVRLELTKSRRCCFRFHVLICRPILWLTRYTSTGSWSCSTGAVGDGGAKTWEVSGRSSGGSWVAAGSPNWPGFWTDLPVFAVRGSTNAKLTEFNARVWSLQGQALRRMRRSVKILKMKTIMFLHPKRPEHFASVVLHRQHGMGPGAEKHRHPLSSCLYVLGWVLHAPATRNAEFCLQGCEWRLLKSKEWERVWEV